MILKPIFAQFEITEGCTHNCIYCYNHYSDSRVNTFARKEVADAIVDNDFFYVTITGGEPLMAREILFDSVKKFKEANMDVSLNSNLYLLTKEDAKLFKNLKLNSVLSSILGPKEDIHDGLTQRKGSFNHLLQSLDFLVGEGINVSMNMVVTSKNLEKVYETGKFIRDNFGIKYFSATPIVPSPNKEIKELMLTREEYLSVLNNLLILEKEEGMSVDSLHPALPCMFKDSEREKYRRFFERRGCVAGKGTITFSPLGDVRVCSHERRVYGNILKNSLEEILENANEWIDGDFIPKDCEPCSYLKKCRGGCRVSAEVVNNEINGLNPYFNGPVINSFLVEKLKKEVEKVTAVKGNIRYREDTPEIITVYVNQNINSRLNKLEFEIFKRFVAGRSFQDISNERGDVNQIKDLSNNLIQKGLLI